MKRNWIRNYKWIAMLLLIFWNFQDVICVGESYVLTLSKLSSEKNTAPVYHREDPARDGSKDLNFNRKKIQVFHLRTQHTKYGVKHPCCRAFPRNPFKFKITIIMDFIKVY